MLAGLSPEERLCCILCRPVLSEKLCQSARAVIGAGLDWERFLDLTVRHRVYGLVQYQLSRALPGVVPRDVYRRLQGLALANSKKSEAMAAELTAVLKALEKAGIRAVPYKGPVLIERIWGDCRVGVYHDLDLLVRPGEAQRAMDVLSERGYRPLNGRAHALTNKDCSGEPVVLIRPHDMGFPLLIDLEKRPVPEWAARPAKMGRLWESQMRPRQFQGEAIWLLPDDWYLMFLVIHTLKHWFRSLHWVAEMWGLIQCNPSAWDGALGRAKEMGVYREAVVSRRVCDLIMGEEDVATGDADRFELQLAQGAFHPVRLAFQWRRFQLAIRRGMVERMLYALSVPFVPTRNDFAFLPLPSWLWPAYAVVRPFRLMATYLLLVPAREVWRRIGKPVSPPDDKPS